MLDSPFTRQIPSSGQHVGAYVRTISPCRTVSLSTLQYLRFGIFLASYDSASGALDRLFLVAYYSHRVLSLLRVIGHGLEPNNVEVVCQCDYINGFG